jgi:hypothetical protein
MVILRPAPTLQGRALASAPPKMHGVARLRRTVEIASLGAAPWRVPLLARPRRAAMQQYHTPKHDHPLRDHCAAGVGESEDVLPSETPSPALLFPHSFSNSMRSLLLATVPDTR